MRKQSGYGWLLMSLLVTYGSTPAAAQTQNCSPPGPLLTLVTDDGSLEDYTRLYPLLREKGVPAVAAIITDFVDNPAAPPPARMNSAQILELSRAGWEIASHTRSHHLLTRLDDVTLEAELRGSRRELEHLGLKVTTVVYPEGEDNPRVQAAARRHYQAALDVDGEVNTWPPREAWRLSRVSLGSWTRPGKSGEPGDTLDFYKARVDEAVQQCGWLIFALHPFSPDHDEVQHSYLGQVIDYAKGRGVRFTTVWGALEALESR
ncbi:peptidoglycan/xylan/chitin deacetylase (PgdA/CDA1 family) [Deinobacterium chartae]|uniref:Peptidoglycan/xylan/chitin deacetylase (PgdA/CDA1 family) n=1 Tax=Deinobacterium chartae TaxID=521158 RepID=A0A841HUQ7_9DEIO|nr:polysaccharide deacetylase family protein [Deinobacterium chartae]MBB6096656.1 peptidoglycan/xylan/chitin deacetylase (PgdA/CDA1 family) [Deinobacterium chartae]